MSVDRYAIFVLLVICENSIELAKVVFVTFLLCAKHKVMEFLYAFALKGT